MQLQLNEEKKELKKHGNYSFPVYISPEVLSNYERGSFSWHWHTEVELTYILEGAISYQVNNQIHILAAGEGLFCNSNALHTGSMVCGQDCRYLSVTFHPRIIYGFDGSLLHTNYINPILHHSRLGSIVFKKEIPWQNEILNCLKDIHALYLSPPTTYELRLQQLLANVWLHMYTHIQPLSKEHSDMVAERNLERLREIISYIHSHYHEQLTLNDIARHVHLCQGECCRFFKRMMKITLFDYLLTHRIEQSLPLLADKSLSITWIAERTGFSNSSYFARVFKTRMNCSPKQYQLLLPSIDNI